jgi:hypothetical protein
MEKTQQTTNADQVIDSIIEAAVRWNSDDADNPDTPPLEWQEVIPLLKAAPELVKTLERAHKEIRAWRDGLNVRSRNMHDAKVGACYANEKQIVDALAKAKGAA